MLHYNIFKQWKGQLKFSKSVKKKELTKMERQCFVLTGDDLYMTSDWLP